MSGVHEAADSRVHYCSWLMWKHRHSQQRCLSSRAPKSEWKSWKCQNKASFSLAPTVPEHCMTHRSRGRHHTLLVTQNTWHQICRAFFSSHQPILRLFRCELSVLQLNSILTPTTKNHHTGTQVKGPSHKTALTTEASFKSLHFWPSSYKSGVPTVLSSGLKTCQNSSQSSGQQFIYQFAVKNPTQEQPNRGDA